MLLFQSIYLRSSVGIPPCGLSAFSGNYAFKSGLSLLLNFIFNIMASYFTSFSPYPELPLPTTIKLHILLFPFHSHNPIASEKLTL